MARSHNGAAPTAPRPRPIPLGGPIVAPLADVAPGAAGHALDVDAPLSDVDALTSELGADDSLGVQLWRLSDRGAKPRYITRVPVAEFSLDWVRDEFGGGDYRARVVDARNSVRRQVTFSIAGAPREDAAPKGAATPGDARIDRLERALEALARNMAQAPAALPPVADPLAMALKIIEAMRPMMAPPPPPAGAGDAAGMFALFNQMLDLRERIAESAEPREVSGIAAVVEKGVAPLADLYRRKLDLDERTMMRRAQPSAPQPAQPAHNQAPAVHGGTAPVQTAPAPLADPIAARLAAQIPAVARAYLASVARADKDPSLYADVVLDALPASLVAELPALLDAPDFAARLVGAVPEWRASAPWFGRLADEMRAALRDDDDDDDDDEGDDDSDDDADAAPAAVDDVERAG